MKQSLSTFKFKSKKTNERCYQYLNKLREFYPNLPMITNNEYEQYRMEFDRGDKTHLIDLIDKSIFRIIEAVARIYAQYNIDNLLPIEDGAAMAIEYISETLNNSHCLPFLMTEYIHSYINLLTYRKITRECNYEHERLQKLDILDFEEMDKLLDLREDKSLFNVSIFKEDIYSDLEEVLSLLTPRQREVYCLRKGITTGYEMSIAEIVEKLGITRAAVYNAFIEAETRVKRSGKFKKLKEYNDLNMGQ